MQLLTVELTNNISGFTYTYTVQVNNWTQFYSRLNTLMLQLSIVENVAAANISHVITDKTVLMAA